MPRECLPDHLKDAKHTDWPFFARWIPRSWNAYCGRGPIWRRGSEYQSKPIPDRGFKSAHEWDMNGSRRYYRAVTFKNGLHIRHGYRWDDVDNYYNKLFITIKVVK